MSEITSTIPSRHHFDGVRSSTSKLKFTGLDAPGTYPLDVRLPLPQSSVVGQSFSSKFAATEEVEPLYSQLWHACAGFLVTLPNFGTRVVYFPQGHIEQVAACTNQGLDMQIPHYNLPSQIFCRVLNMKMSAERETDEVYAQMTLVPEAEQIELPENVDEEMPQCPHKNSHMFIKLLTASDTSTHGGFSVPRRAAEECFPPLDFQQSPPIQDLIAKDLHGIEWKFRHIYRGHPKRHLLTTGWSVFVSQKRLVAGDAVIFLRGEHGELRLGVRRSIRHESNVTSSSLLSSHSMHLGVLAAAAHAVSTKTMFSIFYNPRTSPAEFVIPYQKYVSCLRNDFSVGIRFKMRFETEAPSERRLLARYMGTIIGVGDFDSAQWPNSKWRCLMVGWDEQRVNERRERVSPWEIEPLIAPAVLDFPEPRATRMCLSVSTTKLDLSPAVQYQPALHMNPEMQSAGALIAEESVVGKAVSWKVKVNDNENEHIIGADSCTSLSRSEWSESKIEDMPGIVQDFQFPLQFPPWMLDKDKQQLMLQLKPPHENANLANPSILYPSTDLVQLLHGPDSHLPVMPQDLPNFNDQRGFPDNRSKNHRTLWWSPDTTSLQSIAASTIAPDNSTDHLTSTYSALYPENMSRIGGREASSTMSKLAPNILQSELHTEQFYSSWKDNLEQDAELNPADRGQDCKLFGFSIGSFITSKDSKCDGSELRDNEYRRTHVLSASIPYPSSKQVEDASQLHSLEKQELKLVGYLDQNDSQPRCHGEQTWPQVPLRQRVKVYKQGAIGRAVDLSKFEGYHELFQELHRLFKVEGALNEPGSGWQLVYTDHEGDILLVGDDPWQEFCKIVQKIRILSPLEVGKMACGSNLEEDKARREASKCSADCQDSSAPSTPNGRSF